MLLVTDLDGTLLTSQKTISPRTRQALVEFHQRGGLLPPVPPDRSPL